jgi:hypothetical protein
VSAEGYELGDLGVERLDPVLQAFRLREALRRAVLVVQPDQLRDVLERQPTPWARRMKSSRSSSSGP